MEIVRLKDSAPESKTDLKAAIVTDTGGVDDNHSTNLLGKALVSLGERNGLSKGNGFDYSNQQMNLNMRQPDEAVSNDLYKSSIFGVGFAFM